MPSEPLALAELAERLTRDERLLGLDVGTKTIGLALSDVMRRIATPLETIRRTKFSADAARLLELAKQHGVKIVINTDSHHTSHLDKIRYGVLQARRAWLTPGDVLNTLPAQKFAKAMKHAW